MSRNAIKRAAPIAYGVRRDLFTPATGGPTATVRSGLTGARTGRVAGRAGASTSVAATRSWAASARAFEGGTVCARGIAVVPSAAVDGLALSAVARAATNASQVCQRSFG